MKHAAPIALAIIALFQGSASWSVVQMAQHQSEHHDQVTIQPVLLYTVLLIGIICVLICTGLAMSRDAANKSRQFLDLAVIVFTTYSIPAAIILFYTIKPWLRQVLYL